MGLKSIRNFYSSIDHSKILTIDEISDYIMKRMNVRKSYFADFAPREHLMNFIPKSLSELKPRTLKDSYCTAVIPLSDNLKLQDKYVGYQGRTRIGRILEDMDKFACYIMMKHIVLPAVKETDIFPYYLVTANVDKIDFIGVRPLPQIDLILNGHVSWVGSSSAEITIWLKQSRDGKLQNITRALFVMVARDPLNTGGAFINPLQAQNHTEKVILEQAGMRKTIRDESRKYSLLKTIPSLAEQKLIHSLFIKTLFRGDISPSKCILPKNCVWAERKWLKTMFQAHPEHRNINNTLFGGFIMRQAHELSWNLAILFTKQRPKLKRISNIEFIKPIEINSLVTMAAQVVYTKKGYLMIRVFNRVLKSLDHKTMTNEFFFTYMVPKILPEIIPKTYQNIIIYLEAKRNFDQFMKDYQTYQEQGLTSIEEK